MLMDIKVRLISWFYQPYQKPCIECNCKMYRFLLLPPGRHSKLLNRLSRSDKKEKG